MKTVFLINRNHGEYLMEKFITVAEFTNSHEVKFSLFKSMLKQAKIVYSINNENSRNVKPFLIAPSNLAIEVQVFQKDFQNAREILKSLSSFKRKTERAD